MDQNAITQEQINEQMKDLRFKKYVKYFSKLGKLAKSAGFSKVDQKFVAYLEGLVSADLEKKEKARLKELKKAEESKIKEAE
jgi:hypothetical protein